MHGVANNRQFSSETLNIAARPYHRWTRVGGYRLVSDWELVVSIKEGEVVVG